MIGALTVTNALKTQPARPISNSILLPHNNATSLDSAASLLNRG